MREALCRKPHLMSEDVLDRSHYWSCPVLRSGLSLGCAEYPGVGHGTPPTPGRGQLPFIAALAHKAEFPSRRRFIVLNVDKHRASTSLANYAAALCCCYFRVWFTFETKACVAMTKSQNWSAWTTRHDVELARITMHLNCFFSRHLPLEFFDGTFRPFQAAIVGLFKEQLLKTVPLAVRTTGIQ